MLIEIWERLRGYHKWTESQATIESANVEKTAITGSADPVRYTSASANTLAWNDQTGQKHSAKFVLSEDSPLFSLKQGDAVTIRYNPARPDRFYVRDLFRTRVKTFLVKVLAGTCLALTVIVYILYELERIHIRHQRLTGW
jgi:hypothetical protein